MSFHVAELARNTTHPTLGTSRADGNNGAFDLESPEPGDVRRAEEIFRRCNADLKELR